MKHMPDQIIVYPKAGAAGIWTEHRIPTRTDGFLYFSRNEVDKMLDEQRSDLTEAHEDELKAEYDRGVRDAKV